MFHSTRLSALTSECASRIPLGLYRPGIEGFINGDSERRITISESAASIPSGRDEVQAVGCKWNTYQHEKAKYAVI